MTNVTKDSSIVEEMQKMVLNENSVFQIPIFSSHFLPNIPTIAIISDSGIALPRVSFSELTTASNNWSSDKLLGKGKWKNSTVAIKNTAENPQKPPNYHDNQVKQLLTELYCLNAYRHDNILPLFAYSCGLPHEACLVYQYMPGGSLSDRMKTKNMAAVLNWQQRLKIAQGTARGLQYLHTARAKPLIHGDIKSANILLGLDDEPRIGDFGMAHECCQISLTEKISRKVQGTTSYLPPEFLRKKLTSTKLDVYSFGVVLFELATGLRAHLKCLIPRKYLRDYIVEYEDDVSMLQDSRVLGGKKQFEGLIQIGRTCVEDLPETRPDMAKVLKLLDNICT